jgi:hypothetical protein
MIERFCEELDCTISHGSNSHPGVSMCHDEDDRDIAFLFFQPDPQLQTLLITLLRLLQICSSLCVPFFLLMHGGRFMPP